jgi:5-methyltetrahydrofolate--homocysteine methyltransferase
VGGAALTRSFTRRRIAPRYGGLTVYAKDAMDGLDLANRILDPAARPALERQVEQEGERLEAQASRRPEPVARPGQGSVAPAPELPAPPDLERHVLNALPLDEVWRYVNPQMVYGKHLGLKGRFEELVGAGDEKARMLQELIEELKGEGRAGAMVARAVWRFCPARRMGDAIRIGDTDFPFPRQARGDGLCLADFVAGDPGDHLGLFVVAAGEGIRERAERYKQAGEYLKSHAIQALALETAEAAAEWLHAKLRGQWGFPDPPETTMRDRFRAAYRGKRFSFGYPACPDLALQEPLFDLLQPSEIGVTLTEEHMMDPEASVSALVFHHPGARYFSVD